MPHARQGYEDDLVCHRAGYARISPQNCLERHVKNEDLCGKCKLHRTATDIMCSAADVDPDQLLQIVRNGDIYKYANPVIRPESIPDRDTEAAFDEDGKEGKKQMNTRVIYLNGKRILQGIMVDFRVAGALTERSLVIFFEKAFFSNGALEKLNDISVDEFNGGRLQTRYQWMRTDPKAEGEKVYGQPIESKIPRKGKEIECIGFRVVPTTDDSFTR